MKYFLTFVFIICAQIASAQINYSATLFDTENKPLNGQFTVEVRLLENNGKEIYHETIAQTVFKNGKFSLKIGEKNKKLIKKLSKKMIEFNLQITVNKQMYLPLIKVKPVKTTHPRAKSFSSSSKIEEYYSDLFALQAVKLTPKDKNQLVITVESPFRLPMKGPVISQTLSTLPLVKKVPQVADKPKKKKGNVEFAVDGRRYGTNNPLDKDDVLATASKNSRTIAGITPNATISFEGLNKLSNSSPPDVAGTVGKNHYVQMVNLVFAIYDKTGNLLAGPSNTNSLWQGFGGACEDKNNGDGIVLYDQQADRYILSQFAISGAQSVCFAVSTTSDPLGTYYLYELATQRTPDYYKLGVWADARNNAYFMGTNSGAPNSYDVYAIDRESLLAGDIPRQAQFFQDYANFLLPADSDGSLLPSQGSGGLFYTMIDGGDDYFSDPAPVNDSIDLYEFKVDWDFPSQSTFNLIKSFQPPEIAEFNWTVCGLFARGCLPQADTAVKIDSGSWWPMQRFVYRNFGSYESLLGSWTVDVLATGDHAAPRWFEMRKSGIGQWYMHQQGTFAPDETHRWMSSIAMNGQGDIGMVYNVIDADNDINPGIRFTSRRANEPLGQMRNEASLIEGTGVQTSTFRWGDYSSMNVDPVDECRFWMSAEYIQTTGNNSWNTRIASFNFPDCVSVVTSNPSQAVCAVDDSISFDLSLTGNFTATTNLSILACPSGANCNFSVNPVINPAQNSQLIVSNLATGVTGGKYPMTLIATDSLDASLVYTTALELDVVDGVPQSTQLSFPINVATLVSTLSRTFQWQETNNSSSYLFELATDAAFTNIVESHTTSSARYLSTFQLLPETQYYWRVTTQNICGNGVVSPVRFFTSAPLPGKCEAGITPQTLQSYDFESGSQGWGSTSIEGTNNWQLASTNPDTGIQHWHITNVPRHTDTVLTSPSITLPSGFNTLTLHFNNAQDIEANGDFACWDGGFFEVSVDNGVTFTPIAKDRLLTDLYDGPLQSNSVLPGQHAWCGNPQAYLESIINLDDYVGQTIVLRFRLVTDGAVGFDGWDIDDVKIQSCQIDLGVLFRNGFED
ncbi:MAG: immune inhibitor A [Proteobacteria bacterium]|nr:immune inhibitor A [Pseudomonadota bacterium]